MRCAYDRLQLDHPQAGQVLARTGVEGHQKIEPSGGQHLQRSG